MDNKKNIKTNIDDDLKGFEDFIESIPSETKQQLGTQKKNETNFENFTFLSHDGARLEKLKILFNDKLPFCSKFDQSKKLMTDQLEEISILKDRLYSVAERESSPYKKSISEIFNSYYEKK